MPATRLFTLSNSPFTLSMMPLISSSFSHSVNFCHIKSNGLYPPFPQRPPRGADAAKDSCGRLTEQAGEQGNENDADERHAAPGHELLHALTFYLCVIKK
mgnify:CR=1 FL=1